MLIQVRMLCITVLSSRMACTAAIHCHLAASPLSRHGDGEDENTQDPCLDARRNNSTLPPVSISVNTGPPTLTHRSLSSRAGVQNLPVELARGGNHRPV